MTFHRPCEPGEELSAIGVVQDDCLPGNAPRDDVTCRSRSLHSWLARHLHRIA
jgi:hypothetical protein